MFKAKRTKRLLLALIVLASASAVQSQNFNPIVIGRTPFYIKDGESQIFSIKVDSVTVEDTDTTYHLYKTWDYQSATGYGSGEDECVLPNGPSWIGPKTIKKSDDRYLLFNYLNDTLTLWPNAEVGTSWVFHTFSNDDYLWATVDSVKSAEVYGVTSLLKYISFKRTNQQGDPHPSYPNDLEVIISDSLGFVTLFPFRNLFDQHSKPYLWGSYDISFGNYSLIGLTNPSVGKNAISNVSIYNFEIGDEFHYSSSSSEALGTEYYSYENTKQISIVTDKELSNNNDSIYYTWNNLKLKEVGGYANPEPAITYSEYASSTKFRIADTLYYFPEQAYVNEAEHRHYAQHTHSNGRMRIIPELQPHIELEEDNSPCWRIIWAVKHSGYQSHGYGEGLGYLGQQFESDYSSSSSGLVYYKKGDEVWGNPLNITSAQSIRSNSFTVFPNPVKRGNTISIEPISNRAYTIRLVNYLGVVQYSWEGLQGTQIIPIPTNIQSGLYILQFRENEGAYYSKKLIVQ